MNKLEDLKNWIENEKLLLIDNNGKCRDDTSEIRYFCFNYVLFKINQLQLDSEKDYTHNHLNQIWDNDEEDKAWSNL